MDKEMQEELVLDLPELFALYLRKGIWIILFSLLFGLAFAGMRTVKRSGAGVSSAVSEKEGEKKQNLEKTLRENRAEYLKAEIAKQKELLLLEERRIEKAPLFRLSPDKAVERQMNLYIRMPGTAPELAGTLSTTAERKALVESYLSLFQSGEFYDKLASSVDGLEARDIPDLLFLNADKSAGTISLIFTGENEEEVRKMGENARAYWESKAQGLSEQISMHTLTVLSDETTKGMYSHLVLAGESASGGDSVKAEERSSILSRQDVKKTTMENRIKAISDMEKEEKELPAVEESGSTGFSKRSFAKQAILGILLGGFLSVFFVTLPYLFRKRLPREEELESLYGLTVLGSKKRFPEKGLFPRWSSRLSGDADREAGEDALLSLTKSNLSLLMRDKGIEEEILFAGEDKALLEKTVQFMNDDVPYLHSGYAYDIFKNEESIAKLGKYKTLVFVAKGSSDLRTLLNMKRKCELLGKTVLGVVLF